MNKENIEEKIFKSLDTLARITGGDVTITDKEGVRIKTVDPSGCEIKYLKGSVFDLAKEAYQTNKVISTMSKLQDGAEVWCFPLDGYVLSCNNVKRLKKTKDLKMSLIDSLPLIARVVGGEAVVFDNLGKRIVTVDSKGKYDQNNLDIVSESACESMASQKIVVGNSTSVDGAMAVRMPISDEFGFGFNNEDVVNKNIKLVNRIRSQQTAKYTFSDIIGESVQMKKTKKIARLAAESNSNVLIYGETGTGKELFAHSIHNAGERSNKPFVAINCAAIPRTLIESQLFGYEKGAFTGAKKEGAPGVFEQANGGTLYLDEISEMDIDLQVKLLRVLQEREVIRIGSKDIISLDVKIIASTNKPLDKMIKENKFRQDLFFRLNVFDIRIPPLRHIKDDISLIAYEFIRKMNILFGKFINDIDEEAMKLLMEYDWPGNVRELYNSIEKVFNIIGNEQCIMKKHLNFKYNLNIEIETQIGLSTLVSEFEKTVIEKALNENNGIKIEAAKTLQISSTTLWRKIKKLNINE